MSAENVSPYTAKGHYIFWRFDADGLTPSEIDEQEGLGSGTARACIVARWAEIKNGNKDRLERAGRGLVWVN